MAETSTTNTQTSLSKEQIAAETVEFLQQKLNKRKEKWWNWASKNPHVWQLFCKYAFEMIAAGKKKGSAWDVINRIRWHEEIETKGGEFKISNDFIGWYARMFIKKYPQHANLFTIKPMKEEQQIAKLKARNPAIFNRGNIH